MTEAEFLASSDPARMLQWVSRGRGRYTHGKDISDRKLRLFACACARQVWDRLTDDSPCGECVEINRRARDHTDSGGSWATANLMRKIKQICKNCSGTERINHSRRAVEVAERYADGLATADELRRARLDARVESGWVWCATGMDLSVCLRQTIHYHSEYPAGVPASMQAALFREIVGNPFSPVTLPTVLIYREACRYCDGSGEDQRQSTYGDCPACRGTGNEEERRCPWLTHDDGKVAKIARVIYDEQAWDMMPMQADALEEAGCDNEEILLHCQEGHNSCPVSYPHMPHDYCDGSPSPRPSRHVRGCWVVDLLLGLE